MMVVAWNFVWEMRGLLRFGHEERERGEGTFFFFLIFFHLDRKKVKEICII